MERVGARAVLERGRTGPIALEVPAPEAVLPQQQQYAKALTTSSMVLALLPENKHAKALLATAQLKAGKKKAAGVTVTELCADFQKAEDPAVQTDEAPAALSHPLELTVSLLVEMHRSKDALKLLSCLLGRVLGPTQQHPSLASRGCTRSTG